MTLDYKILGQLYYGPEINETPEIPGTSGYYTSVTGGIANRFVFVASNTNVTSYSDGITSAEGGMLPDTNGNVLTYGDGKFVAISFASNKAAYSTDGITWTASTMPSSANWRSATYGNGKFVAVGAGSTAAYSTDGITWTASTLPSDSSWISIAYGNGTFFTAAYGSNKAAYSTNGITWTESTLPSSANWISIAAGQVNTLVEVQVSIGGQGTPGSYVEIVEPQVLYTVPAGTETTVTSIYVTNQDTAQRTYDLAVVPAGQTLSLKHHIRWDMPVSASDFDVVTAKLTLSAGDKLYVFPSTVNKVGFTAFGVEKS